MKKKRFSVEQRMDVLKQAELGTPSDQNNPTHRLSGNRIPERKITTNTTAIS